MANMPITSCAHMQQLCQHIHLIWTQCNQQCHQKHRYTYISHYWCMPQSRFASCIGYVSITAVLQWSTCRLHFTAHISKTSNPLGFELSSNMHMYYIWQLYSSSLMTTYEFLVWQTYFVFCMPTTLETACIMPMMWKVDSLKYFTVSYE